MRFVDAMGFASHAIRSHRLRSFLTVLGITIGIAAVVLLTSIGTGVQRYIITEFTQFGTNLLAVVPGRTTTMGMSGAVISTVRPLSLEDEQALAKLPGILATVPVVQGNALARIPGRQRRTAVLGVGPHAPEVWQFQVAAGTFLPDDDPRAARPYAVLGSTLRHELFGSTNPLGRTIRLGGLRFRIIGTMASKGQILGFDLDDAVYIPAARALELFDRQSLMEVDVLYEPAITAGVATARVHRLLVNRHGREDFTITTQDQMLDVLGSILDKLTLAIGALGGISLLVGGVGIITIMTIAVHDRTAEIGLLRAIGATRRTILLLFLAEAILLAAAGGVAGLGIGWLFARLLHWLIPALPVHTSIDYGIAALLLSVAVGLGSGIPPARRAAALDPVESLRAE